jgi:hypothetical protein
MHGGVNGLMRLSAEVRVDSEFQGHILLFHAAPPPAHPLPALHRINISNREDMPDPGLRAAAPSVVRKRGRAYGLTP